MESLFRMVIYLVIGILLVAANYWFVRSLYQDVAGVDVVIVPFKVVGQPDEGGKLGSALAHMLQARLTQVQRDLNNAQRTLMETPAATPASAAVKNPTNRLIALWNSEPINVPVALLEPSNVSVSVGGVEVGGIFSWAQKLIARPKSLQLSVFYNADKALVAGSLDPFLGSKGNPLWIETEVAPEKVVDAITYTLIQEKLKRDTGSQVGSLDPHEFQVLLSTLIKTAELNRRVSLGRSAGAEYSQFLPDMEILTTKSSQWLGLAYFTANIAENAGNDEKALRYYRMVEKLANASSTTGQLLDAKAKENIRAKIVELAKHALPSTETDALAMEKIREDATYATSVLNELFGLSLGPTPVSLQTDENLRNTSYWDGTSVVAPPQLQFLPDITYHEVVHRFTTTVAKLPYQGQSGSVLQSYAEVFASLVKQKKLGQTAQDADWVIGTKSPRSRCPQPTRHASQRTVYGAED